LPLSPVREIPLWGLKIPTVGGYPWGDYPSGCPCLSACTSCEVGHPAPGGPVCPLSPFQKYLLPERLEVSPTRGINHLLHPGPGGRDCSCGCRLSASIPCTWAGTRNFNPTPSEDIPTACGLPCLLYPFTSSGGDTATGLRSSRERQGGRDSTRVEDVPRTS